MGPRRASRVLAVLVSTAAIPGLSCGGGGENGRPSGPSAGAPSTEGATASPAPSPSPSPISSGQQVWVPPGTFDCPLGRGEPDYGCDGEEPLFVGEVNAAVDRVIAEQLHLWPNKDLTERVRDEWPIHHEVIRILQAKGYCAGWDVRDLQVRDSQGFAEHYDLFDSKGFLHDAPKRYRATCRPASFPLEAKDRFASVRVGFYGIDCPAGVRKPRNSEGRLPVGCLGHVTATPKDRFFDDVDPRIHGPYITWDLEQRREFVTVRDIPDIDFNKAVRGVRPGPFRLCATVQTHRGCLEAEVIEQ